VEAMIKLVPGAAEIRPFAGFDQADKDEIAPQVESLGGFIEHYNRENIPDMYDIIDDDEAYKRWVQLKKLSKLHVGGWYGVGEPTISGMLSAAAGTGRSDSYRGAIDSQHARRLGDDGSSRVPPADWLAEKFQTMKSDFVPRVYRDSTIGRTEQEATLLLDPQRRKQRGGLPVEPKLEIEPKETADDIQAGNRQVTSGLEDTLGPRPREPVGFSGPLFTGDRGGPVGPEPAATVRSRGERGSGSNAVRRLGLTSTDIQSLAGVTLNDGRSFDYVTRFQCKKSETDAECRERIIYGLGEGKHLRK